MARPAHTRRRRGTAAIEFALCLVFVFTPLIVAVTEWSWYLYLQTRVLRIARDAGRVAANKSVGDSSKATAAQAWAETRLMELGLDVGGTEVEVTYPSDTVTVGTVTRDLLRIEITIAYPPLIGALPDVVYPDANLQAVYTVVP